MKIALVLETSGKGDGHLLQYAREFVKGNTLLVNQAQALEVEHDGEFFLNADSNQKRRVLVLGKNLAQLL